MGLVHVILTIHYTNQSILWSSSIMTDFLTSVGFQNVYKKYTFTSTDIKAEDFKLPEFEIFIELKISGSGMLYQDCTI
jgi:hypothetical protein